MCERDTCVSYTLPHGGSPASGFLPFTTPAASSHSSEVYTVNITLIILMTRTLPVLTDTVDFLEVRLPRMVAFVVGVLLLSLKFIGQRQRSLNFQESLSLQKKVYTRVLWYCIVGTKLPAAFW